jgi:DnaJ domain
MLPPRTRLDPDGYYDRLELDPAATRADIVSAFRAKARVLHPDVPKTGNAAAFVALRQAYDVLSNRERRADYDRKARATASDRAKPSDWTKPEVTVVRRRVYPAASYPAATAPVRQPRAFDLQAMLWLALGAFLCLCVYQAATHLLTPSRTVHADIRPNAPSVEPLSPSAHQALLYGATPVRLAGMPNFYVVPAASPAVLWRLDPERKALVPLGQLPPFSAVQAVRLIRQNGMLEVLVNEHGNGFISVDHLTPGNAVAARRAYCGYNAGSPPRDGEALERSGNGSGTLAMENRASEPAVVKLRDGSGAVVLSVFLGPGGHVTVDGIPEGVYQTEYAIGELWSRGCNSFAAGMRARRMEAELRLPSDSHLVVTSDSGGPAAADIPDQAFERK